jgi:hypothetical protein
MGQVGGGGELEALRDLSDINEKIRTSGIGAETPDLACISGIP